MCLSTNDPIIKIAEKSIVVYKHVTKKSYTTCSSHTKGYVYKLFRKCPIIDLHLRYQYYPFITPLSSYSPRYRVYDGYHSFNEDNYMSNCVFIIPKGSKYIDGWFNDFSYELNRVSETIIYMGMKYLILTKFRVWIYKLING